MRPREAFVEEIAGEAPRAAPKARVGGALGKVVGKTSILRARSIFLFVALVVTIVTVTAEPRSRWFVVELAGAILAAWATLAVFRAWLHARAHDPARVEIAAMAAGCAAGFVFLFQNVLVHDALWYYSYLRSGLVDRNLDLFEEFVLRNPHGMYLPPPDTPIFHLGVSIFQAPVAWLVRPFAILLANAGILPGGDGYGPLEVGAATWSSMMLAIGGVVLTHRLARELSSGPASALAQVALLYASPLAFFAFVWPGYPHAATVFLAGVFLLIWARRGRLVDPWSALLLGLLGGALALVHPQDVVYLALPAVDLLEELTREKWKRTLRSMACLAGGAAVGFAPQMGAWAATSGTLLPHVYSEIGDPFRWSRPAFWDVLFSGYNGLFTWTPLCAVGALGLFLLRREQPRIFRGLLFLLLLEWWAIASYGYWWGGASFGARYFLSAYPVLGIGLAVALHRMARRTGLLAAGLATVPFVFWNLLLMAQFRLEWLPHNQRPDFGAAVARQIYEAPEVVASGLTGAFRWNQALVVEQCRAALESGSTLQLFGFFLVAAGLVALLVAWIARIVRAFTAEDPGGVTAASWSRRASLTGVAAMLLATSAVLAVAHDHGRRRLVSEVRGLPRDVEPASAVTLPLRPRSDGPSPEAPTAVFTVPTRPRGPVSSRLDLVSFLRAGGGRIEGDVVAWVSPRGPRCGHSTYPIRAGHETPETAPDHEPGFMRPRHDLDEVDTIQSWWQSDPGGVHYWGHAYLASWELPQDCEPDVVTVRATPGTGVLELRGIALSSAPREQP
jgi:hypothetical protein